MPPLVAGAFAIVRESPYTHPHPICGLIYVGPIAKGAAATHARPVLGGGVRGDAGRGHVYRPGLHLVRDARHPVSYTHLDVYKRQLLLLWQWGQHILSHRWGADVCKETLGR